MFKWIKNLFVTAEDVAIPTTQKLSEITPEPLTTKKVEKAVKELDTTTNWPFPTARPEENVTVEKVTKASLSKLTKQGLEDFAKQNDGVDIDKRKKKEVLVKEVIKLSKKA